MDFLIEQAQFYCMCCQGYHQFMIMGQGSGMKNNDHSLSSMLESHESSVKGKEEDTTHKLSNYCLMYAIMHVHEQCEYEKDIQ